MRKRIWLSVFIGLMVFVFSGSVVAQQAETVPELKKEIEALQKRVNQLEMEKRDSFYNPGMNGPDVGWDPIMEMNQMQQRMDQMFQSSFGQPGARQGIFSSTMRFDQDIDLKETDQGYEVNIDTTGFDQNKVDVQINEHSLTIKGEQSKDEHLEGPDRKMSSRSFGSFMKTIPLPADADTANAKTEKQGNSLVISLPKKR